MTGESPEENEFFADPGNPDSARKIKPIPGKRGAKEIRVGTDCSGLEIPLIALKKSCSNTTLMV